MTTESELTAGLARMRTRFAAALDGKIDEGFAALQEISGGGETAEIVVVAHRRLHEICGLAPTLGFAAIGNAARSAESVVRAAALAGRALTPAEIGAFKSELEALRATAERRAADFFNSRLSKRARG